MKKLIVFLILLVPFEAEAGLRKLKKDQATAINIHLVNATTGVGITGVSLGSVTGFVVKHKDATSAVNTSITFSGSEVGQGLYSVGLTAAHTDTLQDLTVCYAFTNARTTCDVYTVSADGDPEFLGDFASIPDIWAEPTADLSVVGSVGKRIADNLDIPVSTVPAVLLATPIEGTETFKNFLRYGASMLFSNYTSTGGNFSFKDISGAKNRVVYSTTTTSRTVQSRDATD